LTADTKGAIFEASKQNGFGCRLGLKQSCVFHSPKAGIASGAWTFSGARRKSGKTSISTSGAQFLSS